MWHDILMVVIGLIAGGVLGFFLSRMFMEKYFPEMEAEDIKMILAEYESRNRRFGK